MSRVILPPDHYDHQHALPSAEDYPPGSLTKCSTCPVWFHLIDIPMAGPHWQPLSWWNFRLKRRIREATTPRPMNRGANLINQDIPEGFEPQSLSLEDPEYDYHETSKP